VISIDKPPMAAVRTIGTTGWTCETRAETHPVSASAASTTTKVTGTLYGPGINTIASQGSRPPAAKAALTAIALRSGGVREAAVMPCSASAWAASASRSCPRPAVFHGPARISLPVRKYLPTRIRPGGTLFQRRR
jgi:hypothetical protein